jgi:hypothetical protein
VPFKLEVDGSAPDMDPVQATLGGRFGTGTSVNILVHRDHYERFLQIRSAMYEPEEKSEPKRLSLLERIRRFGCHEMD